MPTVSHTPASDNHLSNHLTIGSGDNGSQSVEWDIAFPEPAAHQHDAETLAPVRNAAAHVRPDDADEKVEVLYRARRLGSSSFGTIVNKLACSRKNVGFTLQMIVESNLKAGFSAEIVNIRPVDRPPIRVASDCEDEGFQTSDPDAPGYDALTNADRDRWCL